MCRWYTAGAAARAAVSLALLVWAAAGQNTPQPPGPDWRPLGGTSVEISLASPATGPVRAVWFSPDGSRLYAQGETERVFETSDFESWTPSNATPPSPAEPASEVARLPEPGARLVPDVVERGRIYALGAHLYRSEDQGMTWTDLTGYGETSVIGRGVRSLAILPNDADHLVAANEFGVWQSLDGGLSWAGLNDRLPNLPVRKILRTPVGPEPLQVLVDGFGAVELDAGRKRQWFQSGNREAERDERVRNQYARAIGTSITAVAATGEVVYAGAEDGRLFISRDRGRNWSLTTAPAEGPVLALWTDPQESRVALAALAGRGPRVLRTTNGGVFWDDLTSDLPETTVRALAADRTTGVIYAATDRGIFLTRGDLVNAAPPTPWTSITGNLPPASAADVRLGENGNQLYVALDGYGVFAAAAPHRPDRLRWVNAADFSTRAPAPGSLVSILGGRVDRVQAGNLQFPVLAASESESQIQVPYEAAGPSVPLALEASNRRSTLTLPIQDVSPVIFVDRDGLPMLLDGDSGLVLNAGSAARSNARIQILATGLGKVRPNWPSGLPAPLENPPSVIAPVRVFVDRAEVEVLRSELAPGYIGFYLVEVQLPAIVNSGPAELYITAGDRESNRVTVYLEP